jgi:hypothetical protein
MSQSIYMGKLFAILEKRVKTSRIGSTGRLCISLGSAESRDQEENRIRPCTYKRFPGPVMDILSHNQLDLSTETLHSVLQRPKGVDKNHFAFHNTATLQLLLKVIVELLKILII